MLQVIGILVIVIAMTCIISHMEHKLINRHFQMFAWFVLICYACGNLYFTLISREAWAGNRIKLIPFNSYNQLFKEPTAGEPSVSGLAKIMMYGLTPIEGIILNILLYYPLGCLLPILCPKLKVWHVILIGCLCSIATEATQYIFKLGWCETDDVIHNTLGTAIGVGVCHLQSKRFKKSTQ